ncbi:hypothetical protein GGR53DRAFT_337026 [Hypoxylon sp. FL1150]|nr:hypothetical protein GGR53DRAFT_337026 [Hypoxylon sp. FL1150]
MATASSQQPANLANNTTTIAPKPPGQPLPESPTSAINTSPRLAPANTHGANGLTSNLVPIDGHIHTDLRLYPRDGRVRNPVPSKLKDVTEQVKGNFSVMHMDVTSHRASEGRDAAAKRTSESTALQARRAQTDGYVSHQRRANYPRPPGLKQFTSPKKSTSLEPVSEGGQTQSQSQPPAPAPAPAQAQTQTLPQPQSQSQIQTPIPIQSQTQPLTMAETKTEQARLLTLLRTLSPNLVVDQLCKALAFFGGIPDAPPPADGKFPESAEANGSGSLFVGWIAEIFPNLDEPRRRIAPLPVQSLSQRRPRGRPKGSKASKSRSDKGVKKGTKGATNRAQDPQDESWVDVEDSVLELNGDADLDEIGDISGNVASTPPPIPDIERFNNAPATGSTGGFKSINDTPAAPGSSTKRRGRPKGSKNRPKDNSNSQQASQPTEPATANLNTPNVPNHISTIPIPPKVTPVPVPIPMLSEHAKKKTNTGRPKGTKNRLKAANDTTGQEATSSQQQVLDLLNLPGNPQTLQTTPAGTSFTGNTTMNNGSASHSDKPTQLPPSTTAPSSQVPTPQVKESTITGKKRKRQAAAPGTGNPQADKPSDNTGNNIMPQEILRWPGYPATYSRRYFCAVSQAVPQDARVGFRETIDTQ